MNRKIEWLQNSKVATAAWLMIGAVVVRVCLEQAPRILLASDAGYPDSYILGDAEAYRLTGSLYREPGSVPLVPTLYSPPIYMLFAAVNRLTLFENPFVMPRLLTLAVVVLCFCVVASLTFELTRSKAAALMAFALPLSISVLPTWLLQLRPDFFGILCTLLACRALLSESTRATILGGIFAGFAVMFKMTLLAGAVWGTVWLLSRNPRRALLYFTAVNVVVLLGYGTFDQRFPEMFQNISTISLTFQEPFGSLRGAIELALKLTTEPVVLLALAVTVSRLQRFSSPIGLLIGMAATSFCGSTVAATQAGANINYFFEALFLLVPVAAVAIREASRKERSSDVAAALIAVAFIAFAVDDARGAVSAVRNGSGVADANRTFVRVADIVAKRNVLALVPRVAFVTQRPEITDTFLANFMYMQGKLDLTPVISRIHQGDYELIVTPPSSVIGYRNVNHVADPIRVAVALAYQPYCKIDNLLFHLPRSAPIAESVAEELTRAKCLPILHETPDDYKW